MASGTMSTLLKFFVSFFLYQGVFSAIASMLKCYEDDCLRAFQHTPAIAAAFCATYTGGVATSTSTPPFVVSSCTSQPLTPAATRLSTACACLAATTSTSSTSVPTSTSSISTATASTAMTSTSTGSCVIATSDPNNLITDPGFEIANSDIWGWNYDQDGVDSSVSYTGTYSSKLIGMSGELVDFYDQHDTFPSDATIYISLAAKFSGTSVQGCYFFVGTEGKFPVYTWDISAEFDWNCFNTSYNTLSYSDGQFGVGLECADATAALWIDNIYAGTVPPSS